MRRKCRSRAASSDKYGAGNGGFSEKMTKTRFLSKKRNNATNATVVALALIFGFAPALFAAPAPKKTQNKQNAKNHKSVKTQPTQLSQSPSKTITADIVLDKIFFTFHNQKIRSMVYDEVRTISTQAAESGPDQGVMQLDKRNASTYIMRSYYRAPDKHGYRMKTKPIEGFWPGTPNQQDAITMDERWPSKVREVYTLGLGKSTVSIRGRKCYILTLRPKPDSVLTFPMTWYVDAENFSILKFMHLIKYNSGQIVSTIGEIFYGKARGHYVPLTSKWLTTSSNSTYRFHYDIRYENYMFNIPLDDSVFKEQPMPKPAKQ